MKKIIDARNDEDGNIEAVLFKGNQKFTSLETAIGMADRGEIENVHAVHPKDSCAYIRTNANGREKDNLDFLAAN